MSRRAALVLAVAALAGCASFDPEHHYDPAADFTAYHSYAWMTHKVASRTGARTADPLIHDAVRKSVDDALAKKGFTQAAFGDADLLVGFRIAVSEKLHVEPVGSDASWSSTLEGTLVIDIADRSTSRMIWRGSVRAAVKPGLTGEQRAQRIAGAVSAILARFPP